MSIVYLSICLLQPAVLIQHWRWGPTGIWIKFSCCSITQKLSIILFCVKNHFQDGCSPLYVASLKGHTDVVDLLVKEGADVHLATIKVY